MIDRFIADEQGDPEEKAMERFLTEQVDTALRSLAPRDARCSGSTSAWTGAGSIRWRRSEMLGVTRERVRQLRDRALKRLREGEVGRALASFAA